MHSFLLRLGPEPLFSGTIPVGDYYIVGNQPISPAKKKRGSTKKVCKTWLGIRNVNLLWVKLTSYQTRYLLTFASFQLFELVWSMHLQCQGFSDVFSAGDGLWPRQIPPNPQGSMENLMVNHLSWWWASLPILTDLPPRYANAEKIMVEESTYTLFSPSQIEGHFPPVDLGILPYPPSNWKKKTNRGRQVFPLPVDLLRWSPAESLLDYNYPQKKTSKFNDHGNLVHSQHPQAVPPGHLFLQCGQIRVFRGRQRATMRRGGDAQGAQLGVLTRRPVETIGFPIYYKYTNPIGDCRITIFVAGKLKPEPRNSGVVEKDWDLHLEVFCFALVTLAPPTPWPSSAQVVDLAPWPGPKSLPPTGQFSLPPTGRFTWFWLQP